MSLIGLLVLIIIVVFAFWLLGQVAIPEPWGKVIRALIALIVILYLLGALGVLDYGPVIRIRHGG